MVNTHSRIRYIRLFPPGLNRINVALDRVGKLRVDWNKIKYFFLVKVLLRSLIRYPQYNRIRRIPVKIALAGLRRRGYKLGSRRAYNVVLLRGRVTGILDIYTRIRRTTRLTNW